MKILIPTMRQPAELSFMLTMLRSTAPDCEVVVSGFDASAAVNRNWCLDQVEVGDIAIMLDDDIEGFYHGWRKDIVAPLADPSVVMVSARLLNHDGSFGPTCSRCYAESPDEIEIFSNGECVLPTAAIAFRHRGHCFDQNYIGSGYEDSDWCHQYLAADPLSRFIQSNKCRLVHRNEMKNQKGPYWKHNALYYWNKWRNAGVPA